MTKLLARRAAIALMVMTFAVAGCGKNHKAANSNVSGSNNTTTSINASGDNSTVPTPGPGSTDPDVVGANIDSTLGDIDSDLSAIDSAPSDEGDPTQ